MLDSISFYLREWPFSETPWTLEFDLLVMNWGSNAPTGPVLYQSLGHATSGVSGFERFDVQTGGVELVAGEKYAWIVNCAPYADDIETLAHFGYIKSDAYTEGGSIISLDRFPFTTAELTGSFWQETGTPSSNNIGDLAFTLAFSAPGGPVIPEPATFAMIGLGAVMGIFRFRRKTARSA